MSTLQALNSADPDQMIQGLHSSLAMLTAQFSVSLQWVPAHVELTGNERAGRLAKISSQVSHTHNPVTYTEAKTLLHSQFNGDRKKEHDGYQAHLDPIWRQEWAHQTTTFRLRTKHCDLSAHLKRIGLSNTSLCECGQVDQTPDHVLLPYPKYAERCQLTWLHSGDLATKLWGLAEDLFWMAGFVAPTDWRSDLHGCWSLKKKKWQHTEFQPARYLYLWENGNQFCISYTIVNLHWGQGHQIDIKM